MISVIIGTFGDDSWKKIAERAAQSADQQTLKPSSIELVHADSLMDARNIGASKASGEWLLFLDADDELGEGYIAAMTSKIEEIENVDALIQPSTIYLLNGEPKGPAHLIPSRVDILEANWMVIGTLVKTETFNKVGGFGHWPIYEDWDLWIRCVKNGSELHTAEDALYIVNESTDSRNNQHPSVQRDYYRQIKKQYL